ncbi:MAG TPA: hypothetical protein VMF31_10750 [Solirubrobacterales bacterium]|nr:hypothetical protein [Solirubrobacterales bacterium]
MIEATFRPIDRWPEPLGHPRRSMFKRGHYTATLTLLERELSHLGAKNVVIQVDLREDQIKVDGWPKAGVRWGDHPGVIVAFDSKHGPLKYATAEFDRWEDNLRGIAKGLEALRMVDRYGITKRGEQYTGWKALPAAGETEQSQIDRGRGLIADYHGVNAALRATHPDHGGDPEDFMAVQAARKADQ